MLTLYGGGEALFASGGGFDVVLAVIGLLLVATHWGWVHVAEYVGVTIDERQEHTSEERARAWLASVASSRFSSASNQRWPTLRRLISSSPRLLVSPWRLVTRTCRWSRDAMYGVSPAW